MRMNKIKMELIIIIIMINKDIIMIMNQSYSISVTKIKLIKFLMPKIKSGVFKLKNPRRIKSSY